MTRYTFRNQRQEKFLYCVLLFYMIRFTCRNQKDPQKFVWLFYVTRYSCKNREIKNAHGHIKESFVVNWSCIDFVPLRRLTASRPRYRWRMRSSTMERCQGKKRRRCLSMTETSWCGRRVMHGGAMYSPLSMPARSDISPSNSTMRYVFNLELYYFCHF